MDEKEPNLKEKIEEVYSLVKENPKLMKKRNIKIPRKAKVNKRRIKKGWVGILRVDENGNLTGERTKIEGSAYKLKSKTYHAIGDGDSETNGREILFWQGRYPIFVQESKKLNPIKFNGGKNETHGQDYVMSLMSKDALKPEKKGLGGGTIFIWIVVIAVAFFIIKSLIEKGG